LKKNKLRQEGGYSMARQINGKGDIREALYDIKTKVAFLAYVHNRIHDQGDLVADIAHEGMLSVFGDIEDQSMKSIKQSKMMFTKSQS